MRETETSAPSLGELSEADTPILYKNWRGEVAVRTIRLDAIAYGHEGLGLGYGTNKWHRHPQWLLYAKDIEKGEYRSFALSGILAWGDEAIAAREVAMAEAVASARAEGPSWLSPDGGPRDRTPVILAAQARADGRVVVGEGYFDPEDGDGKWWWAGESSGDYGADAIETYFGTVIGWMPLPAPPALIPGGSSDV